MTMPDILSHDKAKAERLHVLETEIRQLQSSTSIAFYALSVRVREIAQAKLWRTTSARTIEEYVEKELLIARSTYYNMITFARIMEKYVEQDQKFLDTDHTKILAVSGMIDKEPDKAEEWLEKARVLSLRGLQEEIKVAKGKPDQAICEHANLIWIEKCADCGKVLSQNKVGE